MLKNAGAKDGIKNIFKEFNTPINRAAIETNNKNGDIIFVKLTVIKNFSGSDLKLGANTEINCSAKIKIIPEKNIVVKPKRINKGKTKSNLIGDFILQPQKWVADKEVNKFLT